MRILFTAAVTAAMLGTPSAFAQPFEYVKTCDAVGFKWFYIPGTETCINPETGEIRDDEPGSAIREGALLKEARDANEGVALSLALPTAIVDNGKTFGAAMNFGTFNGESAVGIGGAVVAADGLTITGALGVGLGRGTAGGRAGVNYSW